MVGRTFSRLAIAFVLLFFGSSAGPIAARDIGPDASRDAAAIKDSVDDLLQRINDVRRENALALLSVNALLTTAAQLHSEDMAEHGTLSHTGSDGSGPEERVRRAGYHLRAVGENLAFGASPAETFAGWMKDPAHRVVILNPTYRDFGGGAARKGNGPVYWTVDFGQLYQPLAPPPPVTQQVGPSGGDISIAGGAASDEGVTVHVPPGAFPHSAKLTLALANSAPSGVRLSGAMFLPKTVEITIDTGAALRKPSELRVNLTAVELAGLSIESVRGVVIVGDDAEPRPTRVIDARQGVIGIMADHFSKFSVITVQGVGPGAATPPTGTTLDGFGVTLGWTNPPRTTQIQLQLVPFNGDGPGLNVIRNAEDHFKVPAPPEWYGLLPDMSYYWRVRSTSVRTHPQEQDWSAWGSWSFRTPKASSATLRLATPADASTVASRNPTLRWTDSNPALFYYELWLSKDPTFSTDPASASAMVYTALLHAGATSPPNSYRVPDQFPLEPATVYYWQLRPRVQGDGTPVPWSPTWTFRTP